jgi:hypothetical protein
VKVKRLSISGLIFFLMIFLFSDLFGQRYNVWHPAAKPEFITISLDIEDVDTVFCLFWPTDPSKREPVSRILPNLMGLQARHGEFTAMGGAYISMWADSSNFTRMLDTLVTYKKTISYDNFKGYYIIEDDSSFIKWGAQSAPFVEDQIQYLAPIKQERGYGVPLSGELNGASGFAIFFKHDTIVTDDPAGSGAEFYLTFWQWH